MGSPRVFETEIYASHMQFSVVDPHAEYRTDLVWDGSGLRTPPRGLAGIVAVGTIGYCPLRVRLELWETEPPVDLDD